MKTITGKGTTMPVHESVSTDFTPICMVGITWTELNSLLDQRTELLKENHPLDQIEVVIEVPQIGGMVYGHKCRLKIKEP